MSGESITIASSRDDEHSLCYAMSSPKTELFDHELLILRIQRRLGKNQGDIRNQRMKLHPMRCNTIHLLTKKRFEKLANAPLNMIFVEISFFKKWFILLKLIF
jgi:hypothetical protein